MQPCVGSNPETKSMCSCLQALQHLNLNILHDELKSAKSSLVHFFAPAVVLVVLMEPKEMADKIDTFMAI